MKTSSLRTSDVKPADKKKPAELPPLGKRILLATIACAHNVLAAGIVYGWASIAGSMLVAPESQGGAGLTVDQTTGIFSMAVGVSFIASLFLGIMLDCCGPRACSFFSHAVIGVGCQVISIANSYSHFAAGACLLAFGGPGITSSIVHVANLFPKNRFLMMSTITGTITLSFNILLMFDILWFRYHVGFRTLFGWYSLVIGVSALSALLLFPDKPFEVDDFETQQPQTSQDASLLESQTPFPESGFVVSLADHEHMIEQPLGSTLRHNEHHKLDRHSSYFQSKKALESGKPEAVACVSLKDRPFRDQVASGCYLRITFLFIVFVFSANFVVGSVTVELADRQGYVDSEQHQLTRLLTSSMSFGILASPAVGWLMDVIGWELCTILTIVVAQVHTASMAFFFESKTIMIIGFIFYTLFRQLLFPVYLAGIMERLGFKFFGMLSGLGCAASGVVQFFMSDLVQKVQGTCHLMDHPQETTCDVGIWKELHIFHFVLFCVLVQIPLLDYRIRERERRMKEERFLYPAESLALSTYGSTDDE